MFYENQSTVDVARLSFNGLNVTWQPDTSSWVAFDDVGGENSSSPEVVCSNEYCMSTDDYLNMIRDYVFPTMFEWVLTTLYVIVFLIGLTGNALVVYVVWRNSNMRTVTNLFIVNLSIADLLVIVVCLPPTTLVDITETWFFGLAMCKIVHYVQVRVNSFTIYRYGCTRSVVSSTACYVTMWSWSVICRMFLNLT